MAGTKPKLENAPSKKIGQSSGKKRGNITPKPKFSPKPKK